MPSSFQTASTSCLTHTNKLYTTSCFAVTTRGFHSVPQHLPARDLRSFARRLKLALPSTNCCLGSTSLVELGSFHSPLLTASQLLSLPAANDMLKFAACFASSEALLTLSKPLTHVKLFACLGSVTKSLSLRPQQSYCWLSALLLLITDQSLLHRASASARWLLQLSLQS